MRMPGPVQEVTGISAVSGWGLDGLMNCVWGMLQEETGGSDRAAADSAATEGARRA